MESKRTEYRPHEPYFCEDRTYSLRVRELVEAESKRVHPMSVGQGGYPFQKENYRLNLPTYTSQYQKGK